MSKEYRDTVMQLFRARIIRILVCTDAAGMVSQSFSQRVYRVNVVIPGL
jgi:superfamily II DNA/RNA helicase